MKSITSAVAPTDRKRVIRTLLSAAYICLFCTPLIWGRIEKDQPLPGSSKAAKTVGESNSGKHKKSIDDPFRPALRYKDSRLGHNSRWAERFVGATSSTDTS